MANKMLFTTVLAVSGAAAASTNQSMERRGLVENAGNLFNDLQNNIREGALNLKYRIRDGRENIGNAIENARVDFFGAVGELTFMGGQIVQALADRINPDDEIILQVQKVILLIESLSGKEQSASNFLQEDLAGLEAQLLGISNVLVQTSEKVLDFTYESATDPSLEDYAVFKQEVKEELEKLATIISGKIDLDQTPDETPSLPPVGGPPVGGPPGAGPPAGGPPGAGFPVGGPPGAGFPVGGPPGAGFPVGGPPGGFRPPPIPIDNECIMRPDLEIADVDVQELTKKTWYGQYQQVTSREKLEDLRCVTNTFTFDGVTDNSFEARNAGLFKNGEVNAANACVGVTKWTDEDKKTASGKFKFGPCFLFANGFSAGGPLWVLDHHENWEWVVIIAGQPNVYDEAAETCHGGPQKGMWINTRDSQEIGSDLYETIKGRIEEKGVSTSQLVKVEQGTQECKDAFAGADFIGFLK